MRLVVATRNKGKLKEIQTLLSYPGLEIISLSEFPGCPEVIEDGESYLDNARKKACAVAQHCGAWALADDSGLEVDALGGLPGVRSARYAGESANDEQNNQKLLEAMVGMEGNRRSARFRCVLVLRHPDGRELSSEGELRGHIGDSIRGQHGFGYDPIFIPEGKSQSLAEISAAEKNLISHRRNALERLQVILQKLV